MDNNPATGVLLFAGMVLLTGLLNGFMAAIESLNDSTVEAREERDPVKAKKILHIMEDTSRLQITIMVCTVLMALITGWFVFGSLSKALAGALLEGAGASVSGVLLRTAAYIITAFYLLALMAVLAFFVPKCLGSKYEEAWAFRLFGIVNFIMTVLRPFIWIIRMLSQVVLFLFGINLKELNEEVTEEEIKSIIDEGHEQGVLEEDEAEMISNIFEFGDKMAKDIMTHRKSIVSLDGEMTLKEAMNFILDQNYTRFPVYEGDMDNIIGILHVKDAMIYYSKEGMGEKSLLEIRDFLREPVFIPETRNINTLFRDMQSEKIHMEIVMDEYGQTSGLVAMEDILEEIVGNIFDEYDEEENNIVACEDGSYLVKGMTELDELEEEIGLKLEDDDYDTLNGYLISRLDRILSENDLPEITVGRCHFDILAVENKLISLVRITISEDETESEETEDEIEK